jgi:glycerol kinase
MVFDQDARVVAVAQKEHRQSLTLRWLLQNIPGAREKTASGDLLFGNVDTFLLSNLTGGAKGGVHVTDVTNAGRTQPLSVKTLD